MKNYLLVSTMLALTAMTVTAQADSREARHWQGLLAKSEQAATQQVCDSVVSYDHNGNPLERIVNHFNAASQVDARTPPGH